MSRDVWAICSPAELLVWLFLLTWHCIKLWLMYESYLSWVEFVLSFQAASSKDLWLRIVLSIHAAAPPNIGKYDWFIFCFTFDPNITHTRAHAHTKTWVGINFFKHFFYWVVALCAGILYQRNIFLSPVQLLLARFFPYYHMVLGTLELLWQIDSTLKNKGYNGWFITACLLNFQSSCILFHAHWGSY